MKAGPMAGWPSQPKTGRTRANGERCKEGNTVSKRRSVENDGGADGELERGACTEELKREKKREKNSQLTVSCGAVRPCYMEGRSSAGLSQ